MKMYKSFDEIEEKFGKTINKILRKFKQKMIRFKYFAEILKKIKKLFLNKFYVNFGSLQDS